MVEKRLAVTYLMRLLIQHGTLLKHTRNVSVHYNSQHCCFTPSINLQMSVAVSMRDYVAAVVVVLLLAAKFQEARLQAGKLL